MSSNRSDVTSSSSASRRDSGRRRSARGTNSVEGDAERREHNGNEEESNTRRRNERRREGSGRHKNSDDREQGRSRKSSNTVRSYEHADNRSQTERGIDTLHQQPYDGPSSGLNPHVANQFPNQAPQDFALPYRPPLASSLSYGEARSYENAEDRNQTERGTDTPQQQPYEGPNSSLNSHVPNQFPDQAPQDFALPYRPPLASSLSYGEASSYYGDQGESVAHQPGVRPHTPVVTGTEPHLMAALPVAAPPVETGHGAAAEFFGSNIQGTPSTSSMPTSLNNVGVSSSYVGEYTSAGSTGPPNMASSFIPLQPSGSQPSYGRPASQSAPPSSYNVPVIAAGAVGAAGLAAAAWEHEHHHSHHSSHHSSEQSNSGSGSLEFAGPRPSEGRLSDQLYGRRARNRTNRGPVGRLVDWWRNYEDVQKMEEYTQYIGVCRYCFDPDSTLVDAPRSHRHRWRVSSGSRKSGRVDKNSRYSSSSSSSSSSDTEVRRRRTKITTEAAGVMGAGIAEENHRRHGDDREERTSRREGNRRKGNKRESDRRDHVQESSTTYEVEADGKQSTMGSSQRHDDRIRIEDGRFSEQSSSRQHGRRRSEAGHHSGENLLLSGAAGIAVGEIIRHSDERGHKRNSGDGRPGTRHRLDSSHVDHRTEASASARDEQSSDNDSNVGFFGFIFSPSLRKDSQRRPKRKLQRDDFEYGSSSFTRVNGNGEAGVITSKRSKPQHHVGHGRSQNVVSEALMGIGAAALLAGSDSHRTQTQHNLFAARESRESQRNPYRHVYAHQDTQSAVETRTPGDDDWTDDEASSVDSALAFGDFEAGRTLSRRSSSESLASASSATRKWNWRWNKKGDRGESSGVERRRTNRQETRPAVPVVESVLFEAGGETQSIDQRHTSFVESATPQSLKYIDPIPVSETNSPDPTPIPLLTATPVRSVALQQPQPISPIRSPYIDGTNSDRYIDRRTGYFDSNITTRPYLPHARTMPNDLPSAPRIPSVVQSENKTQTEGTTRPPSQRKQSDSAIGKFARDAILPKAFAAIAMNAMAKPANRQRRRSSGPVVRFASPIHREDTPEIQHENAEVQSNVLDPTSSNVETPDVGAMPGGFPKSPAAEMAESDLSLERRNEPEHYFDDRAGKAPSPPLANGMLDKQLQPGQTPEPASEPQEDPLPRPQYLIRGPSDHADYDEPILDDDIDDADYFLNRRTSNPAYPTESETQEQSRQQNPPQLPPQSPQKPERPQYHVRTPTDPADYDDPILDDDIDDPDIFSKLRKVRSAEAEVGAREYAAQYEDSQSTRTNVAVQNVFEDLANRYSAENRAPSPARFFAPPELAEHHDVLDHRVDANIDFEASAHTGHMEQSIDRGLPQSIPKLRLIPATPPPTLKESMRARSKSPSPLKYESTEVSTELDSATDRENDVSANIQSYAENTLDGARPDPSKVSGYTKQEDNEDPLLPLMDMLPGNEVDDIESPDDIPASEFYSQPHFEPLSDLGLVLGVDLLLDHDIQPSGGGFVEGEVDDESDGEVPAGNSDVANQEALYQLNTTNADGGRQDIVSKHEEEEVNHYGVTETSKHDESSVAMSDAFAGDVKSDKGFEDSTGVANGEVYSKNDEDILATDDVVLDHDEVQHARDVSDLSSDVAVDIHTTSTQTEDLPGPMPGSFVFEDEPQACDVIDMSGSTMVQDHEMISESSPSISDIKPREALDEAFMPSTFTPHEDPIMPEPPAKSPATIVLSNQSHGESPAEAIESDSWPMEATQSKEDETQIPGKSVAAVEPSNSQFSDNNTLECSTSPAPLSAIHEWTSTIDQNMEQNDFDVFSVRTSESITSGEQQAVSKEQIGGKDESTQGRSSYMKATLGGGVVESISNEIEENIDPQVTYVADTHAHTREIGDPAENGPSPWNDENRSGAKETVVSPSINDENVDSPPQEGVPLSRLRSLSAPVSPFQEKLASTDRFHSPSRRQNVFDLYEIVPEMIRLPPSRPGSPYDGADDITEHSPSWSGHSQQDSSHSRTPSTTAIPLRFRRPPQSPGWTKESSFATSPNTETGSPTSPTRVRAGRPKSTEFKSNEFRPLYLVARNTKLPEPEEEILPTLPPSRTTSRASSLNESNEGYESAAESPENYEGPSQESPRPLPNDYNPLELRTTHHANVDEEGFLDSQQTTPKAGTFPPGVWDFSEASTGGNLKQSDSDECDPAVEEQLNEQLKPSSFESDQPASDDLFSRRSRRGLGELTYGLGQEGQTLDTASVQGSEQSRLAGEASDLVRSTNVSPLVPLQKHSDMSQPDDDQQNTIMTTPPVDLVSRTRNTRPMLLARQPYGDFESTQENSETTSSEELQGPSFEQGLEQVHEDSQAYHDTIIPLNIDSRAKSLPEDHNSDPSKNPSLVPLPASPPSVPEDHISDPYESPSLIPLPASPLSVRKDHTFNSYKSPSSIPLPVSPLFVPEDHIFDSRKSPSLVQLPASPLSEFPEKHDAAGSFDVYSDNMAVLPETETQDHTRSQDPSPSLVPLPYSPSVASEPQEVQQDFEPVTTNSGLPETKIGDELWAVNSNKDALETSGAGHKIMHSKADTLQSLESHGKSLVEFEGTNAPLDLHSQERMSGSYSMPQTPETATASAFHTAMETNDDVFAMAWGPKDKGKGKGRGKGKGKGTDSILIFETGLSDASMHPSEGSGSRDDSVTPTIGETSKAFTFTADQDEWNTTSQRKGKKGKKSSLRNSTVVQSPSIVREDPSEDPKISSVDTPTNEDTEWAISSNLKPVEAVNASSQSLDRDIAVSTPTKVLSEEPEERLEVQSVAIPMDTEIEWTSSSKAKGKKVKKGKKGVAAQEWMSEENAMAPASVDDDPRPSQQTEFSVPREEEGLAVQSKAKGKKGKKKSLAWVAPAAALSAIVVEEASQTRNETEPETNLPDFNEENITSPLDPSTPSAAPIAEEEDEWALQSKLKQKGKKGKKKLMVLSQPDFVSPNVKNNGESITENENIMDTPIPPHHNPRNIESLNPTNDLDLTPPSRSTGSVDMRAAESSDVTPESRPVPAHAYNEPEALAAGEVDKQRDQDSLSRKLYVEAAESEKSKEEVGNGDHSESHPHARELSSASALAREAVHALPLLDNDDGILKSLDVQTDPFPENLQNSNQSQQQPQENSHLIRSGSPVSLPQNSNHETHSSEAPGYMHSPAWEGDYVNKWNVIAQTLHPTTPDDQLSAFSVSEQVALIAGSDEGHQGFDETVELATKDSQNTAVHEYAGSHFPQYFSRPEEAEKILPESPVYRVDGEGYQGHEQIQKVGHYAINPPQNYVAHESQLAVERTPDGDIAGYDDSTLAIRDAIETPLPEDKVERTQRGQSYDQLSPTLYDEAVMALQNASEIPLPEDDNDLTEESALDELPSLELQDQLEDRVHTVSEEVVDTPLLEDSIRRDYSENAINSLLPEGHVTQGGAFEDAFEIDSPEASSAQHALQSAIDTPLPKEVTPHATLEDALSIPLPEEDVGHTALEDATTIALPEEDITHATLEQAINFPLPRGNPAHNALDAAISVPLPEEDPTDISLKQAISVPLPEEDPAYVALEQAMGVPLPAEDPAHVALAEAINIPIPKEDPAYAALESAITVPLPEEDADSAALDHAITIPLPEEDAASATLDYTITVPFPEEDAASAALDHAITVPLPEEDAASAALDHAINMPLPQESTTDVAKSRLNDVSVMDDNTTHSGRKDLYNVSPSEYSGNTAFVVALNTPIPEDGSSQTALSVAIDTPVPNDAVVEEERDAPLPQAASFEYMSNTPVPNENNQPGDESTLQATQILADPVGEPSSKDVVDDCDYMPRSKGKKSKKGKNKKVAWYSPTEFSNEDNGNRSESTPLELDRGLIAEEQASTGEDLKDANEVNASNAPRGDDRLHDEVQMRQASQNTGELQISEIGPEVGLVFDSHTDNKSMPVLEEDNDDNAEEWGTTSKAKKKKKRKGKNHMSEMPLAALDGPPPETVSESPTSRDTGYHQHFSEDMKLEELEQTHTRDDVVNCDASLPQHSTDETPYPKFHTPPPEVVDVVDELQMPSNNREIEQGEKSDEEWNKTSKSKKKKKKRAKDEFDSGVPLASPVDQPWQNHSGERDEGDIDAFKVASPVVAGPEEIDRMDNEARVVDEGMAAYRGPVTLELEQKTSSQEQVEKLATTTYDYLTQRDDDDEGVHDLTLTTSTTEIPVEDPETTQEIFESTQEIAKDEWDVATKSKKKKKGKGKQGEPPPTHGDATVREPGLPAIPTPEIITKEERQTDFQHNDPDLRKEDDEWAMTSTSKKKKKGKGKAAELKSSVALELPEIQTITRKSETAQDRSSAVVLEDENQGSITRRAAGIPLEGGEDTWDVTPRSKKKLQVISESIELAPDIPDFPVEQDDLETRQSQATREDHEAANAEVRNSDIISVSKAVESDQPTTIMNPDRSDPGEAAPSKGKNGKKNKKGKKISSDDWWDGKGQEQEQEQEEIARVQGSEEVIYDKTDGNDMPQAVGAAMVGGALVGKILSYIGLSRDGHANIANSTENINSTTNDQAPPKIDGVGDQDELREVAMEEGSSVDRRNIPASNPSEDLSGSRQALDRHTGQQTPRDELDKIPSPDTQGQPEMVAVVHDLEGNLESTADVALTRQTNPSKTSEEPSAVDQPLSLEDSMQYAPAEEYWPPTLKKSKKGKRKTTKQKATTAFDPHQKDDAEILKQADDDNYSPSQVAADSQGLSDIRTNRAELDFTSQAIEKDDKQVAFNVEHQHDPLSKQYSESREPALDELPRFETDLVGPEVISNAVSEADAKRVPPSRSRLHITLGENEEYHSDHGKGDLDAFSVVGHENPIALDKQAEAEICEPKSHSRAQSESLAEAAHEASTSRHGSLDNVSPTRNIEFAATLAAGLEESGFDSNIVIQDLSLHSRAASPGSSLDHADGEFPLPQTTRRRRKSPNTTRDQSGGNAAYSDSPNNQLSSNAVVEPSFEDDVMSGLSGAGFKAESIKDISRRGSLAPSTIQFVLGTDQVPSSESNEPRHEASTEVSMRTPSPTGPSTAGHKSSTPEIDDQDATSGEHRDRGPPLAYNDETPGRAISKNAVRDSCFQDGSMRRSASIHSSGHTHDGQKGRRQIDGAKAVEGASEFRTPPYRTTGNVGGWSFANIAEEGSELHTHSRQESGAASTANLENESHGSASGTKEQHHHETSSPEQRTAPQNEKAHSQKLYEHRGSANEEDYQARASVEHVEPPRPHSSVSSATSEIANTRRAYKRSLTNESSAVDKTLSPRSLTSSPNAQSHRSITPTLRRTDRSLSGTSPHLLSKQTPASASRVSGDSNLDALHTYAPLKGSGKDRRQEMAKEDNDSTVFESSSDLRSSPRSQSQLPRVDSMHDRTRVTSQSSDDYFSRRDLGGRDQRESSDFASATHGENAALVEVLQARDIQLHDKEAEINNIRSNLQMLQYEVTKLHERNEELQTANGLLSQDTNGRYATLQSEHAHAHQQWQKSTRELEDLRSRHGELATNMDDIVEREISAALTDKDGEIRQLRMELDRATEQIRFLQREILASKPDESYLTVRDEDYFEAACQQLCEHVQRWVLRFSKSSDNRRCRMSEELRNEAIETRLDNAVLDGTDVDLYLGDRIKRRDVFMSVVMTMIWEYVFTRYLFGMDREQRQKLKALEKTLIDVGPPRAVAQWRVVTLTLLSKREAFTAQRAQDTEAVVQEIYSTLAAMLPPPGQVIKQLQDSLRNVMKLAVDLSIEMRTQRPEYVMLPPLHAEYDSSGNITRKVYFNSLMNERSGDHATNAELEGRSAAVRLVLFPLVVKRGDDQGEGDEEIVVLPAQVLVAKAGKEKKVVRVRSGAMSIDSPNANRSMQSIVSSPMEWN